MVQKVVSNDERKVLTVSAGIFFDILQPTHFISKLSYFLSEGFFPFKKRELTGTHCEIPQIVEEHVMF